MCYSFLTFYIRIRLFFCCNISQAPFCYLILALYIYHEIYEQLFRNILLEYTVTKQGTVKDPVVIDAEPAKIFNNAAIKSALKYKYKPRVVDGVPQEVKGVKTRVTFKLGE